MLDFPRRKSLVSIDHLIKQARKRKKKKKRITTKKIEVAKYFEIAFQFKEVEQMISFPILLLFFFLFFFFARRMQSKISKSESVVEQHRAYWKLMQE